MSDTIKTVWESMKYEGVLGGSDTGEPPRYVDPYPGETVRNCY